MPRIAAVAATLVVVVLSIGINMWRYPVVWEMTAAPGISSNITSSSQPDESPPTAEQSSMADEPVCIGNTCSIGLAPPLPVDEGLADEEPVEPSWSGADMVAPSAYEEPDNSPYEPTVYDGDYNEDTIDTSSSADDWAPEETPDARSSERTKMVPVIALDLLPEGGPPDAGAVVRRLPAVDPDGLSSEGSGVGSWPADSTTVVYPSTEI